MRTNVTAQQDMEVEIVKKISARRVISHRQHVKILQLARKIELAILNVSARPSILESSVKYTSSRIHCAIRIHALTMAHAEFHLAPQNGNVFVLRASLEIAVKSTTTTASRSRVRTEVDV